MGEILLLFQLSCLIKKTKKKWPRKKRKKGHDWLHFISIFGC